jgi:uncharacterized RDD family membrane protein YckC
MSVASHTAPVPYTPSTTTYAGVVTRAVAFAADVAIVYALLFLIGVVVGLIISAFSTFSPDADIETILGAAAVWFLTFGLYLIAFWSLAEQTPGMRMLGIEVTTLEGGRLPVRRSFVRLIGMALAAIPLFAGYSLILLRDDRRGLHDLMARSEVRYAEKKRPPRPYRGPLPPSNI